MSKTERFKELLDRWGAVVGRKGRPVSAFETADGGCHAEARAAYARRFNHCKLLAAVDQDLACVEPLVEVANASARRVLWLYMFHCLGDYPGKPDEYARLRARNNANLLVRGIEVVVTARLSEGRPSDAEFAARVLDDAELLGFAAGWLARQKGNRAGRRALRRH
jgi:hypothetical protein